MLNNWRSSSVKIMPGELKQISFGFNDLPNIFLIGNKNDVLLYGGIEKIPSVKSYEYLIEKNNFSVMARPVPSSVIWILNPSESEVEVSIYHVLGEFDVSMLRNMNSIISSLESSKFDGVIKEFDCSLPSGSNRIGKVLLDSEIPEGHNHVGFMSIQNSIPEGDNIIGRVKIENSSELKINSISPYLMSTYGFTSYALKTFSANNGTQNSVSYEIENFCPFKISCLNNCAVNNVPIVDFNPLTIKLYLDGKLFFECGMKTDTTESFFMPEVVKGSTVRIVLVKSNDYHNYFYVKIGGYVL